MKCDGCTLCCKLLPVDWMNSPAGEYCKECEPGKGCKIYDRAPKNCLKFRCAYNQMEKVSINMRPDKCGVIFERIDDIFIGTVDTDTDKLNNFVLDQLTSLKNEGFSFVLYKQGKPPYVYPVGDYTAKQILQKIKTEVNEINGRS